MWWQKSVQMGSSNCFPFCIAKKWKPGRRPHFSTDLGFEIVFEITISGNPQQGAKKSHHVGDRFRFRRFLLHMNKIISPRVFAILLVFACACTVRASYAAEGSFTRKLNVSGTVDLDVSTGSGSIDVREGPVNQVEIRATIRASNNWFRSDRDSESAIRQIESNPPIEQSGQSIRIGRVLDRELEQHVSISYEIVAPALTNIR